MNLNFKFIPKIAFVFLLLVATGTFGGSLAGVSAQQVNAFCSNINLVSPDAPPSVAGLICPLVRVINVLLFGGAIVFAIMVAYGGIKLSLALGDPKGFEAAKLTVLYSFMGLAVVLGSFSVMLILARMLGVTAFTSPDALFSGFLCNLRNLLNAIGVTDPYLNSVPCAG